MIDQIIKEFLKNILDGLGLPEEWNSEMNFIQKNMHRLGLRLNKSWLFNSNCWHQLVRSLNTNNMIEIIVILCRFIIQ